MPPKDEEESMPETDEKSDRAALEEELAQIEDRMGQIKAETTEELIRDWPSPWRNEAMTQAKVSGRLSAHKEYQTLLVRQRKLNSVLGVTPKPRGSDEAQDPMGSYAMKLAKASNAKEKGQ